jgi:hypothetical protein
MVKSAGSTGGFDGAQLLLFARRARAQKTRELLATSERRCSHASSRTHAIAARPLPKLSHESMWERSNTWSAPHRHFLRRHDVDAR